MTTLVLNRALLRIQETQDSRSAEPASLSMNRMRPGVRPRRDTSSSFHFQGDAYLYDNTRPASGHDEGVDAEALQDEDRTEWESTLRRKHEQMMLWNDQIQLHSRIMSGEVEGSWRGWW